MKTNQSRSAARSIQASLRRGHQRLRTLLAAAFLVSCLAEWCQGQGTFTVTFNGTPRGTEHGVGSYEESGIIFQVLAPGQLFLEGGGYNSVYPDNGTGFLYMPDGSLGGVTFVPTNAFIAPFSFLSFDAAEAGSGVGSYSFSVIGYIPMAGAVTNTFTFDGINDGSGPQQDFETFYLDSSFANVFRVDFRNTIFALDNVTIGPVPEPSAPTLILLGGLSAAGWARLKKRRAAKPKPARP